MNPFSSRFGLEPGEATFTVNLTLIGDSRDGAHWSSPAAIINIGGGLGQERSLWVPR